MEDQGILFNPEPETSGAEATHELNAEQSRLWEENHKAIMDCMHGYMQTKFSTPTIAFIAEQTGLSRPTVRKHIRGFSAQPDFQEHTAMFKFMTTSVLRQLYTQAMNGDVKASRLYMELMGVLKYNAVVENNFISVPPKTLTFDGVAINEEFIEHLVPSLQAKLTDAIRECIEGSKTSIEGAA